MQEPITPLKEAVDLVIEEGGDALKECYQCGLCTGTCPWNLVKRFNVREMIHQAQLGIIDFESDAVWSCTTCRACVQRCPRGVSIIDIMKAFRRAIVEYSIGGIPDSLRLSVKNISGVGNPVGEAEEKRVDWVQGIDVKTFTEETEVLYLSCCIPAYDSQARDMAQAAVKIMHKAGVDFGILGIQEMCCGESVRKAGQEELFQSLAQQNIDNYQAAGVKKIVTASPHCYHTIKNEYPELGGSFEVVHFSQFLVELIQEERLGITGELNKTVTYHDACYLGRHNDVYDEPRRVLETIPGLKIVEMVNHHENGLCCGGGGGGIWMETRKGERLSDIRVQQAIDTGADIMVVSCPYCMLNFKDSVLTMDKSDLLEIKSLEEIVAEVI
jgi:Fe-S oxidoreductase